MSGLAAVGLARDDQTISLSRSPSLWRRLAIVDVAGTRLGNRLGMSGEEARKEYGHGAGGLRTAIVASGVAGAVVVVLRLIRNLGSMPHA